MKDRTASALDFPARPQVTRVINWPSTTRWPARPVARGEVVPPRVPRALPYAMAATIAAVVLLLVTSRPAEVNASAPRSAARLSRRRPIGGRRAGQARRICQESKDPEIELAADLKQAIEELKQPNVDSSRVRPSFRRWKRHCSSNSAVQRRGHRRDDGRRWAMP